LSRGQVKVESKTREVKLTAWVGQALNQALLRPLRRASGTADTGNIATALWRRAGPRGVALGAIAGTGVWHLIGQLLTP